MQGTRASDYGQWLWTVVTVRALEGPPVAVGHTTDTMAEAFRSRDGGSVSTLGRGEADTAGMYCERSVFFLLWIYPARSRGGKRMEGMFMYQYVDQAWASAFRALVCLGPCRRPGWLSV